MLPSSAQGVVVTGATGDPMRCPSCNYDNPGDASFYEAGIVLSWVQGIGHFWGAIMREMRDCD
jgi:hypothetical protein